MRLQDGRLAWFVHVPRTGGTSIRQALRLGYQEIHVLPDATPAGAWRFAFIRDPLERAVSLFCKVSRLPRTPEDFRGWVADGMPCREVHAGRGRWIRPTEPQARWLEGVEWVGRFWRLEEDFAEVAAMVGRPRLELPHVNRATRIPDTKWYDEETRDAVARRYAEDAVLVERVRAAWVRRNLERYRARVSGGVR